MTSALTSLVVSVALVAFGVVLLSSPLMGDAGPRAAITSEPAVVTTGEGGDSTIDDGASSEDNGEGWIRPVNGDDDDYYYDAPPTPVPLIDLAPLPTSAPSTGKDPNLHPPLQQPPSTTDAPTKVPTGVPTKAPTDEPAVAPAKSPTDEPTKTPADEPTKAPNEFLTDEPTKLTTDEPTAAFLDVPTKLPMVALTKSPTVTPTKSPADEATAAPSDSPTKSPNELLTDEPTKFPTDEPTAASLETPTKLPTVALTESPTVAPRKSPTHEPTAAPSESPTTSPNRRLAGPRRAAGLAPATPRRGLVGRCRRPRDPSPPGEPTDEPAKFRTDEPTAESSDAPTKFPTVALTKSPTAAPTKSPTDEPTGASSSSLPTESPSVPPSTKPTINPSSSSFPSASSRPSASSAPTPAPLFPTHAEPLHPKPTYFNFNTTEGARYGPSNWHQVVLSNSSYWHEFGFVENQCQKEKVAQSPIDVCAKPERHCLEHHEFRSKRGDFRISGNPMTKQILPDKLRVLVARRTGEEPDPPHVDFAGVGAGNLDLLHIDLKFPSEHKVCGRRYDGEMRYYFFHPVKKSLLVVTWLLEAQEEEVDAGSLVTENRQMQYLINEFQELHDWNKEVCSPKSKEKRLLSNGARSTTLVGSAPLANHHGNGTNYAPSSEGQLERRKLAKDNQKKGVWDPFHPDIQKTIHFWGYTGSLTEPPCTGNTLWRIMDVPVQISAAQLRQMKRILFNNQDNHTCDYTSTHYEGSVARPIDSEKDLRYYKCTRSDYVSDDERERCGNIGCADYPFGKALYPYVEPIVRVTGPPTESPTASMSAQAP